MDADSPWWPVKCAGLPSAPSAPRKRLAERCEVFRTTRQTLEVMQVSRAAVENGIGETERARQSLDEIIHSSRQVENEIELIATAATEQTAASGEISESAALISQLAAETAHGADEAVEALKNLARLADDLDAMIHQFSFGGVNGDSTRQQTRRPTAADVHALRPARV